jgi:hypothetical protein
MKQEPQTEQQKRKHSERLTKKLNEFLATETAKGLGDTPGR